MSAHVLLNFIEFYCVCLIFHLTIFSVMSGRFWHYWVRGSKMSAHVLLNLLSFIAYALCSIQQFFIHVGTFLFLLC